MTSNQLKTTVKDLLWRAANTFWQAFTAVFVLPAAFADFSAWESAVVAGAAAGLSAVKTFVSEYIRTKV